jgi:hypothetical protein
LSPTDQVGSPRLVKLVEALPEGKRAVVFMSSPEGLSAVAMTMADAAAISVFHLTSTGRVDAANDHARRMEAALRAHNY